MKRQDWSFFLAWMIALAGCCLSLFYGEILQHPPCPLCWYQRIALFPLVFLLGVAVYRADRAIILYALPLAVFGLSAALLQVVNLYFHPGLCSLEISCTDPAFMFFGFLSFPVVSALGFSLIAAFLKLSR